MIAPPPTREPDALQPAWEIAHLFPYQGGWEEYDYLELETNHLVEYNDGYVEVLEMPTQTHQLIVAYLYGLLLSFAKKYQLGLVLFAPLRVRLRPRLIREPDVVFMRAEHAERRSDKQWERADLVMEVVSDDPKSRERDLETKRSEYAQAGIPEYWIVDPTLETITVLKLTDDTYEVQGEFKRGETAGSALLDGFTVDVSAAFDAGQLE